MNNITNISKQDLLQTNTSAVTSTLGLTVDSDETAIAVDSTDLSDSFRATFQKVSDQLTFNEAPPVNEVGGKNLPADLPLTGVFSDLSAENDHWMFHTDEKNIIDEDESLTAEDILSRSSFTDGHVDEELNYSTSSLMPSLSASSPSSSSLMQASEAVTVQLRNVSDSQLIGNKVTSERGNDLAHVNLSHTAGTKPVSESITRSNTQQELSPTSTALLQSVLPQSSLGKIASETTDSRVMNVSTSKIEDGRNKETVNKEIVTKSILNNINSSGEESLQGQLLTLAKSVSKGEDTNDTCQKFIESNVSTRVVENETTLLQDDLVASNDVLLKTKQNLYTQKPDGSVEPSPVKSNSVTSVLSNVKLNNQEAVELSKFDATVSSTMNVSNPAEEITPTVATINAASSPLRTVLQTKLNTKISQVDNISVTLSGNSTRLESTKLENSLMQSMDGLSLTAESSGLLLDKVQNLSNASTQHSLFPAVQAASLIQTAAKVIDTNSDNLLGITSPALNNITSVNSPINAMTPPLAEITEAFGRSAWPQAMGKQVLSMINQNIGSAEIRLNPAHLGPIEILIDMTEDQVNVSLTSRHAVVREAMEQALPKLREMLDENGFNLADADVSKHSFAEQREHNTKHDDNARDRGATTPDLLTSSEINDPALQRATDTTATVDYFV